MKNLLIISLITIIFCEISAFPTNVRQRRQAPHDEKWERVKRELEESSNSQTVERGQQHDRQGSTFSSYRNQYGKKDSSEELKEKDQKGKRGVKNQEEPITNDSGIGGNFPRAISQDKKDNQMKSTTDSSFSTVINGNGFNIFKSRKNDGNKQEAISSLQSNQQQLNNALPSPTAPAAADESSGSSESSESSESETSSSDSSSSSESQSSGVTDN